MNSVPCAGEICSIMDTEEDFAYVTSPEFGESEPEEEKEAEGVGGRRVCERCGRPARVCWCPFLPQPPLEIRRSEVIILQHPNEAKRGIREAVLQNKYLK